MKLDQVSDKTLTKYPSNKLLSLHRRCHQLWQGAKNRKAPKEFFNKIEQTHDVLVNEMKKRKMNHNSPLVK